MKIFITSTDTNVGKTVVAAWLCVHLNANYWKPVQSGAKSGETDSEFVKKALNSSNGKVLQEKYVFDAFASPHLAAKMAGEYIQMNELYLPEASGDRLIVEGAGGVLVPLNDESTVLDLIVQLNIPTLIVARSTLGTINHTCLTIEALSGKNVPIVGVIINGSRNEYNRQAIEKYGKVSVLDEVEAFKTLDYASLKERMPAKKLMEAIDEFSRVG